MTTDRSIIGRSNRRRGAQFERECAEILTDASGVTWTRTKPGDEQPFGDLVPRDRVPDDPWCDLYVECKAHKTVVPKHIIEPTKQVLSWWDSTVSYADVVDRPHPILFMRILHWRVVAMMNKRTFDEIHGGSKPWRIHLSGGHVVVVPASMLP